MRSRPTSRRHRLALPAALCALGLLTAACGGEDEADDDTVETIETVTDGGATGDTAGEPADDGTSDRVAGGVALDACQLVDPTAVDALLGVSGSTASTDTSLGLADGCRFATAPTDVAAVVIGYASTLPFEDARELACDGDEPVAVPAAAPEAVECFGAIVAPSGDGGTLIASLEDPTTAFDETTAQQIVATVVTTALTTIATV